MTKEKSENKIATRKGTQSGVVVSDKGDKTIVVSVSRFVKHPKYGKYYKIDKKFKVHDEDNKYKVGDKVTMMSTRPISKDKKWKVL